MRVLGFFYVLFCLAGTGLAQNVATIAANAARDSRAFRRSIATLTTELASSEAACVVAEARRVTADAARVAAETLSAQLQQAAAASNHAAQRAQAEAAALQLQLAAAKTTLLAYQVCTAVVVTGAVVAHEAYQYTRSPFYQEAKSYVTALPANTIVDRVIAHARFYGSFRLGLSVPPAVRRSSSTANVSSISISATAPATPLHNTTARAMPHRNATATPTLTVNATARASPLVNGTAPAAPLVNGPLRAVLDGLSLNLSEVISMGVVLYGSTCPSDMRVWVEIVMHTPGDRSPYESTFHHRPQHGTVIAIATPRDAPPAGSCSNMSLNEGVMLARRNGSACPLSYDLRVAVSYGTTCAMNDSVTVGLDDGVTVLLNHGVTAELNDDGAACAVVPSVSVDPLRLVVLLLVLVGMGIIMSHMVIEALLAASRFDRRVFAADYDGTLLFESGDQYATPMEQLAGFGGVPQPVPPQVPAAVLAMAHGQDLDLAPAEQLGGGVRARTAQVKAAMAATDQLLKIYSVFKAKEAAGAWTSQWQRSNLQYEGVQARQACLAAWGRVMQNVPEAEEEDAEVFFKLFKLLTLFLCKHNTPTIAMTAARRPDTQASHACSVKAVVMGLEERRPRYLALTGDAALCYRCELTEGEDCICGEYVLDLSVLPMALHELPEMATHDSTAPQHHHHHHHHQHDAAGHQQPQHDTTSPHHQHHQETTGEQQEEETTGQQQQEGIST